MTKIYYETRIIDVFDRGVTVKILDIRHNLASYHYRSKLNDVRQFNKKQIAFLWTIDKS